MDDAEPWWAEQGYPADPYVGGPLALLAAGLALAYTEFWWWWDGSYSPKLILLAPTAAAVGGGALLCPLVCANCPSWLRKHGAAVPSGEREGSRPLRRLGVVWSMLLLVVWTFGSAEVYCRWRLGSTLFPWFG